jgi:hypothetical protein
VFAACRQRCEQKATRSIVSSLTVQQIQALASGLGLPDGLSPALAGFTCGKP